MKVGLMISLIALALGVSATLRITTIYTTKEGLPNNEVRALYNDPAGSLWLGIGGGAAFLDNAQWKMDSSDINPVRYVGCNDRRHIHIQWDSLEISHDRAWTQAQYRS